MDKARSGMDCEAFRSGIQTYYHVSPAPELMQQLAAHARGCEPCAELLRTCEELSCREFSDSLHVYVTRDLADERQQVFERHLGICPDCRNYLDSYRRVIELCSAAFDEGSLPSEPVPEELLRAILKARGRG
jgi:predicted anti-sigma-YlaC factor YlaD